MTATQPSKLLSSLFAQFDPERRLTVLHIGPALPETVEFFSRFRSKLYFVDLFSELPIEESDDGGPPLVEKFGEILDLPSDVRFDICLFWDLFNFLDSESIAALLENLSPRLQADCLAHVFAAYNRKSVQGDQLYGIKEPDTLQVRHRGEMLPGYAPHAQSALKDLLYCFSFDRSVLLADSRVELLLKAKLV
jgi:hypothetical protein